MNVSMRGYFADVTRAMVDSAGELADNVFDARIQGTYPDDFQRFRNVRLRSVPVEAGAAGDILPDDRQRVAVVKPARLRRISAGAYADYCGSRWLVYRTRNIAAVCAEALLRRCNAVMTLPDHPETGPVPISYTSESSLQGNITQGSRRLYTLKMLDCVCQLNDETAVLEEGMRVMLDGDAFLVRSLDRYSRDLTFDPDSAHLLSFTLTRSLSEPIPGRVIVP